MERLGTIDYGEYEAEILLALNGMRILLVDDDPDIRAAITAVLEQCGATVVAVDSASAALELVPHLRPNVLVSDIAMPDMDGHRLIRSIRELGPRRGGGTPAVALTAYASPADRARALLAGYQIYLPKPFEPRELVTLVARLAGRRLI